MKRLISVLLFLLLLVMSFSVIHAADSVDDQGNPNDPTVNDRANACYAGGSLEGKCDSDILWAAGWYLIRFEFGTFERGDIPTWVVWVLPPEVVPAELASNTQPPGANPNNPAGITCALTYTGPMQMMMGGEGYNINLSWLPVAGQVMMVVDSNVGGLMHWSVQPTTSGGNTGPYMAQGIVSTATATLYDNWPGNVLSTTTCTVS